MAFVQVKSRSSDDVYDIFILQDGGKLQITCSCPAGQKKTVCWHRLAIMEGDATAVVAGSEHVSGLKMLVGKSHLLPMFAAIEQLEVEADQIKKRLSAAKKALGAALG